MKKLFDYIRARWTKKRCYDQREAADMAIFGLCNGVASGDVYTNHSRYLSYSCVDCKYHECCVRIEQCLSSQRPRCEVCDHYYNYDEWDRNRGESYMAYECRFIKHDLGFDGYCSMYRRKGETK